MNIIEPIHVGPLQHSFHPQACFQGKQLGLVVLAGGQATRLQTTMPKGVLPFDVETGESLVHRIAKRVLSFGKLYGKQPLLALMTSEQTHQQTKEHCERYRNFSLKSLSLFLQDSLPLQSMDHQVARDASHAILYGPDGNGSVFRNLERSGILRDWMNLGVEALSIIVVDNPLLDPFLPDMYAPIFSGASMTAAAVVRTDPQEQVGLFVRKNHRICVLEYSELDPKIAEERMSDGSLRYALANISFFVTTPHVALQLARMTTPLHKAKKHVAGQVVWKSEYFIFDYLPMIDSLVIVPIDRDRYFSPIKDPKSLVVAQQRVQALKTDSWCTSFQ